MDAANTILLTTAAGIAVAHSALGPDHYLPFVGMSRAGHWSRSRLIAVTLFCGLGHVLSSVVLGLIGVALGVGIGRLGEIETLRGDLASWGLIAFGLVYFVWGVRRARRGRTHTHVHRHGDGEVHLHEHQHQSEHLHPHPREGKIGTSSWVLFTIFLLGPCEPMIPLLMFPAARGERHLLVAVTIVFSTLTIGTMIAAVLLLQLGVERISTATLDRWSHAAAGATIFFCGAAIRLFGV
ncbi:MAG: hypothetical protein WBX15_18155 [Thermoanaerobaculia bacterium]